MLNTPCCVLSSIATDYCNKRLQQTNFLHPYQILSFKDSTQHLSQALNCKDSTLDSKHLIPRIQQRWASMPKTQSPRFNTNEHQKLLRQSRLHNRTQLPALCLGSQHCTTYTSSVLRQCLCWDFCCFIMAGKSIFTGYLYHIYTNRLQYWWTKQPQRLPHHVYTQIHSSTAEPSNRRCYFNMFTYKSTPAQQHMTLSDGTPSVVTSFGHVAILQSTLSSSYTEKKRKEKTMPFGVNLMRSPVSYT